MRTLHVLAAAAALLALAGCDQPAEGRLRDARQELNQRLVQSYGDDAIKGAVMAQHTLYPYHFVPNAAVLNKLGENDLQILAEHFRDHPGQVNVRRGDATTRLFRARVQTVLQAMEDAGVDTGKLVVTDALPGGDGMPSEQVLEIRAQADSRPQCAPPKTSVAAAGTK